MRSVKHYYRQLYDWPTFTGNNANTYSTQETLAANLIQKNNLIINTSARLVVSEGTIYVIDKSQDNKIYAVDIATNGTKWQYVVVGEPTYINTIIAIGKMVFLATYAGLFALEDTGSSPVLKWSNQDPVLSINYNDNRLYYIILVQNTPTIVMLDSSNGNEIKRSAVGKPTDNAGKITVGGGHIYFTVGNSMDTSYYKLYSVDEISGQVQWTTDLGDSRETSTGLTAYKDGKLYLDSQPSSYNIIQYLITSYDASTGKSLWKYNVAGSFTNFGNQNIYTLINDSVFTLSRDGYLISINKDTGSERWRVRYSELLYGNTYDTSTSGNIIATSDKVLFSNSKKTKIFDASSGVKLSEISAPDSAFVPIAAAEKTLILSSQSGLLTYVPAEPGTISKPIIALQSLTPKRISAFEPLHSETAMNILLSETANVHMNVLNSSNQIIRKQDFGRMNPGQGVVGWNARDDQGKPAPYGKYHFAFDLENLSGITAHYEFPDMVVTIGDTTAVTLTDVNLRSGPGTQYGIIQVVPTGTNLLILDDAGDWLYVNYTQVSLGINISGYVSKKLVSTYSNPVLVTTYSTFNYLVQAGDTLYKIASKNNSTVPAIISANNLTNPNALYIGQMLVIPVMTQQPVTQIHVVAAGDTLWKLSTYYNVPMAIILKNNPSINPGNLYIGQKILIR